MPRSKPKPTKRSRPAVPDGGDLPAPLSTSQSEAIAALSRVPRDDIERVAAAIFEADLVGWDELTFLRDEPKLGGDGGCEGFGDGRNGDCGDRDGGNDNTGGAGDEGIGECGGGGTSLGGIGDVDKSATGCEESTNYRDGISIRKRRLSDGGGGDVRPSGDSSRRRGCASGIAARLPKEFDGLGRVRIASASDRRTFAKLHDVIKRRAPEWASWSGSDAGDNRRRAFGFLPGTPGCDASVRSLLDVSAPDAAGAVAAEERGRNVRAYAVLDASDLPEGTFDALDRLLANLRPFAPPHLRRYVNTSELIAAQPNLHRGRRLLPAHFDHPSRDGFGVVIATIAIEGSASVAIESSDGRTRGKFALREGDAYLLSGNVRDACAHGVLADVGSDGRESLNLRFGLHGRVEGVDPRAEDVLKHWK